ncbi:unnamed protein product [Linum trigynum]|uniref:Uncharacterized protein n=1 Tax=Linum trigynum TaxID=586398 RepID=A0AAV2ETZ3_9ROSI
MGTSWEGEMLQRTMSMAVSDFYALHSHFNTRLLLRFINSTRNHLQALSSADDLLNKSPELRGIISIGPRRSLELEYLAKLFDEKFGIPVISISSRPQVKEGIAKCIIWDLASAAEKASRTAAESHSSYFGDLENFAAPIGEFSGVGNRVIYRPSRSRRRSLNEEANDENIVRNHSNYSSYNASQSGVIPKKLRVGVPLQAGFDELFKVQVGQNWTIDVSGFCVDVFKVAIHLLPYEVSYEFVPFVNDPQPKPWIYNDLVYQVYLQVDMFLHPSSIHSMIPCIFSL